MKTYKKILLIIFIGVIVFVTIGKVMKHNETIRDNKIRSTIAIKRSGAVRSTDAIVKQMEDLLINSGVAKKELASSKVDICYLNTLNQGLFAVERFQECYLRYVIGFTTDSDFQTIKSNLVTQPETESLFGKPMNEDIANCIFEKDFNHKLVFVPKGNLDKYLCVVPNQFKGLFSIRGSVILEEDLNPHIYKHFDKSSLDLSKNTIWIIQENHYYYEEIGCGGILCSKSPRSSPIY